VVGEAHSAETGGAHAEVRALAAAGRSARGATMYVTLEPCPHVGRTGPCTDAILRAGLARVVVGVRDPAAHARGKGIAALRRGGVVVVEGVLADACRRAHEHYIHSIATGLPFVTLKAAISLDGRIACKGGKSRWITGELARKDAHRERARHHAVAVGSGTVAADDPRLDVRMVRGVDPVVIVFDTRLREAARSGRPRAVLREGTLVLHGPKAPARARAAVRACGAEPVEVAVGEDGRIDLADALRVLGELEIRSLLVEGGAALLGAFVRARAWQRFILYQAPRLLGEGVPLLAGVAWDDVAKAPRVCVESRRALGEDLRVTVVPAGSP
jgi:diaminohydroxyphosphoribosylaminopyrimidine deaminase/5-amino-6-(5-phosphoribosylamino)uracil reductase